MSHTYTRYCITCKDDTWHTNGLCCRCHEKQGNERITLWNEQSIDTKLDDLRKRVEKLEQLHLTLML